MLISIVVGIVCVALLLSWGFAGDRKGQEGEPRHCFNCGYDLRGGHERCPECGKPVPPGEDDDVPALCDDLFLTTALQPRPPRPDEKLVCVCHTSSTVESAFLTQLLENRGIIAVREGQERPTDYQPVNMRLMVWTDDSDAAAALVAEVRRRHAARHGIVAE